MTCMCWRQRSDGRELGCVRLPVRLIGLADSPKRTYFGVRGRRSRFTRTCQRNGPIFSKPAHRTDRNSIRGVVPSPRNVRFHRIPLIPHPLRRSRDLNFQPRFSQNSALGPTEIRYGGMAHVSWKVRFHRIPFTRRKVVAIAI